MCPVGIHIDGNIFFLNIRSLVHMWIGSKCIQHNLIAIRHVKNRSCFTNVVIRPIFPYFRIYGSESPSLPERECSQIILSTQTKIQTYLITLLIRIIPIREFIGVFNGKYRFFITIAFPFEIIVFSKFIVLYIGIRPQIPEITDQIVPANRSIGTFVKPCDHLIFGNFASIGQRQRLFLIITGIE